MKRADVIDLLYRKSVNKKALEYDQIPAPMPLRYFFLEEDMQELRRIATSNKLAANPKMKYQLIDQIMRSRGFMKMASGTNRVVYKFLEDQSFVVKTAIDAVGMKDTPREQYNQYLLQPFCTKIFDVHPSGVIGQAERVQPILSREEFLSIAPDIFDIIISHLVGKHVIDDFGSDYYQNWAVRIGAHPVICDFPYVFQLDPDKLTCTAKDPFSPYGVCGGEIDYDPGFNRLICKKCGKQYNATDLKKPQKEVNGILLSEDEDMVDIKVSILQGDKVIQEVETKDQSTTYKRKSFTTKSGKVVEKPTPYEYRQEKRIPIIDVHVIKGETDSTEVTTPVEEVVEKAMEIAKETVEKENHPNVNKFNQNTTVHDQPSIAEVIPTSTVDDEEQTQTVDEYIDNETKEIVNNYNTLAEGANPDYQLESESIETDAESLFTSQEETSSINNNEDSKSENDDTPTEEDNRSDVMDEF